MQLAHICLVNCGLTSKVFFCVCVNLVKCLLLVSSQYHLHTPTKEFDNGSLLFKCQYLRQFLIKLSNQGQFQNAQEQASIFELTTFLDAIASLGTALGCFNIYI